ncbi:MAG TPA: ATP-binding protein [Desulfobacteraceae bacterium]|nr:ATP-binding protein [Desulfobacteraceae bacterium]HPJ67448.1 ATP-binding protein [Desulfobacteraceae bacterium]HPQ27515.1 ATP-binding protein [Desulfobacteraceae bacterium]
MKRRTPYIKIWQDIAADKSMIFLAGPRQAGKTTLAQIISDSFTNSLYFNWDIAEHRTDFMRDPLFFEKIELRDSSTPLIVLDEIHKYKDWKNYLKGVYDQFHDKYQFLISGSGRLDLYQKGGDSLAGRYFLFHLWPFTISELGKSNRQIDQFLKNPLQIEMENTEELKGIWSGLSELSGFPESYLSGKKTTYRRWSNIYSQQLIREDIRDLTGLKSVLDMETLYYLLPSRIGSPISAASLARDLKVSYNSIQSWLSAFERFFLCFSIGPWTQKIARAIQKERKVYLWDTPRIKEPAARFENMVALELYRAVTAWNDMGYGRFSLHFIKNKEQQEVDFLIANDGEPIVLVEAKLSDTEPSQALRKFQGVLKKPAIQLVEKSESYRMIPNGDQYILVTAAYQWLSGLP